MKPKIFITLTLFVALVIIGSSWASSYYYSHQLCSQSKYTCIKAKRGDTWEKLFPNARDQEVVKKINRTNMRLRPGFTIAVPNDLNGFSLLDFSPFPHNIDTSPSRDLLIVDLSDQAFAAYDTNGTLLRWGPVSAGKDYCPDVHRGCRTPTGVYSIGHKGGPSCISSKYPIPRGGAPMPYCMYFRGGYALHGSHLPGRHDSHGCVRLFYDDAVWLNTEFVNNGSRTKVIVRQ